MRATRAFIAMLVCGVAWFWPGVSAAQVDYRNVDAGRPLRVSSASPTPRHSLEFSLVNARVDKLSDGRYRLQLEPSVRYGILPRTEISLRSPLYANERTYAPRQGVGGVGVGAEHLLTLESQGGPAVAVATEIFVPTGPRALPATYSVKVLSTKSLPTFRLHFNGSYGDYKFRVSNGSDLVIPPIQTPCNVVPIDGATPIRLFCAAPVPLVQSPANAQRDSGTTTVTHGRWLVGLAADHTLPLRSVLLTGDVFAQKFGGIERPADWSAEIGTRVQLTRTMVVDGAVGRVFTGESHSTFLLAGLTVSRPYRL